MACEAVALFLGLFWGTEYFLGDYSKYGGGEIDEKKMARGKETGRKQPRTQALYVLIIQLYIERSVNKLASARGCLGRF